MRIRIREADMNSDKVRISDYFFRPKKVFVLLTPPYNYAFFLNGQIIAMGNESICSVHADPESGKKKNLTPSGSATTTEGLKRIKFLSCKEKWTSRRPVGL